VKKERHFEIHLISIFNIYFIQAFLVTCSKWLEPKIISSSSRVCLREGSSGKNMVTDDVLTSRVEVTFRVDWKAFAT